MSHVRAASLCVWKCLWAAGCLSKGLFYISLGWETDAVTGEGRRVGILQVDLPDGGLNPP